MKKKNKSVVFPQKLSQSFQMIKPNFDLIVQLCIETNFQPRLIGLIHRFQSLTSVI